MPDISIDRTTYIKIGNSDPLTTGIAEGTMLIDRVLFAQDFLFGQFASSMFEIQIYGIDNVAGQKIEVYQKENDTRTDLFVGQIESSKLDNAGYYRDIIAYDKFYFISKKNVADWFNGLWTNNTEISVLNAFKSLLAYFDIDYDPNTVTAANFSGTLHKDSVVSFEKISFKDMVKYLLEPLGLIPYINESGKGAVFSPSMANTVDLSGKYDVNQSVFEEFTVNPMQWVGIQNIDSAILQQIEITGNTSDIRYDLAYNPIRLDLYVEVGETARTAVLTNFTNKANFTEYKPCEVFMIVSDMSIKLGDKITTTRGTAYVSEMILSGPMLVEQQLISRGSQVQQEVEEEYDPVFAYLDNRITETADDLQQQLDDFEPSEEYLEKVGEFSDTIAGGMGLQVITYKAQDGSVIKYFYAPPPAGSAVTGIAGSNFIFTMKSTGFAWTNKWEGAPDASSESHVDPGTGDTVSTQWTSGISANGNALLKILNAYKISADIVTTGTLQSEDGDVSIDLDNQSINFGDKLTYDPQNGLNIDGTVTIGGSATIGETITNEVNDAVEALDIKGIDHETIEYQSGISATTVPTGTWLSSPPSVSAGRYLWTRKITYYSDGTDNSNTPLYTVARQGSNGTSVSISSIQYGTSSSASTEPTNYSTTVPTSLTKGTWLWTKTTYSNNSTAITKTYIGTDGDDGDSVLVSNPVYDSTTKTTTFTLTDKNGSKTVTLHDGQDGDEGEHVHFAWADNLEFSQDTPGSFDHSGFTTNNQYSTNKPYIGVCADSNTTDPQTPSSYSWTLVKGADGSDVDHYDNAYAISTSGTQPPEDGYAVRYYWAAKYNNSGFEESMAEYFPVSTSSYYKNSATDPYASNVGWDSTKLYLYSFIWHYTDYGNSLEGYLTDFEMCAVYNQSLPPTYPEVEQSVWQETPPDTSQYKGQYLWTRTTVYYTSGAEVVTYSVAYIGTDGTSGRGISSTAQYYYATATDSATLPAVGTSSWKSLPSQLGTPFSQSVPYLWSYTQTNYTSGNPDRTTPTIIGVWGQDGSGSGISSITPQYALSTSNSTAPTSGWSETVPEYPTSESPTASGEFSSATSTLADILHNLNFVTGVTYTVSYEFSATPQSGKPVYLYVYVPNSTKGGSMTNSTGSFTFTVSANCSNVTVGLNPNTNVISYKVTVKSSNSSTRYYYWQRDKIEWTDNTTSYTTAVLSAGFNSAIYTANRLNPLFCEAYLGGSTEVYMDAGHIYANSLTAYNVTAYEAFIKNLMAHQVDVDGDITINSPALDASGITVSKDDIALELYGKSFSQLTSFEKTLVITAVAMRKVELAALEQSKLKVTDNTNWTSVIVPSGLYASNEGETKASHYGYGAEIYGDLTVHGTINGSGGSSTSPHIEKFSVQFPLGNNSSSGVYSAYQSYYYPGRHVFSGVPIVSVTPRGFLIYASIINVWEDSIDVCAWSPLSDYAGSTVSLDIIAIGD